MTKLQLEYYGHIQILYQWEAQLRIKIQKKVVYIDLKIFKKILITILKIMQVIIGNAKVNLSEA